MKLKTTKGISRKVAYGTGGAVAGATGVAPVLLWILGRQGVDMPVEVAAIIGGWITAAVSFGMAYLSRERG